MKGTAAAQMLPARAGLMNLMGVLAGKWPHTLSIQPGGSTRAISRAEQARLRLMLAGFRAFCETVLFAAPLEKVAGLTSREALYEWAEGSGGDAAHFLRLSRVLGLSGLGRTSLRHMSLAPMPGPKGRCSRAACSMRRPGRGAPAAGRDHRGYFPCLVSRRGRGARMAAPSPT
jgi:hydrogenase large subunit